MSIFFNLFSLSLIMLQIIKEISYSTTQIDSNKSISFIRFISNQSLIEKFLTYYINHFILIYQSLL